jgi:Histidine kinase-, DNA gyrase B-, and HSP90-like ATPase
VHFEIANPDAAGTLEALSSLGYSVESAVADLVDNSIDAGAGWVDVRFRWDGGDSSVAVLDDGQGMDPATLLTAMTPGARRRGPHELGRFGMGLKTASFSQCRQLVVAGRPPNGDWHIRTWDLDVVTRTGQWRLLEGCPDDAEPELTELIAGRPQGAVVLWHRLQRLVHPGTAPDDEAQQQQFYGEICRVESHLGMTFQRFLEGTGARLDLRVNGNPVHPWDPFLRNHRLTQQLPEEDPATADGLSVHVRPFVLPHRRYLDDTAFNKAAGPRGWLDQQGYYVYRNRRLILAGEWLDPRLRRDDKHILARISVDVPATLDTEWSIDVKKSSAAPPPALRASLYRIARSTRNVAANVLAHRGRVTRATNSSGLVLAWSAERRRNRLALKINRDHPLVRDALTLPPEDRQRVKNLLRLLEETVPVAALRQMYDVETAADPEPFSGTSDSELVELARHMFAALVRQGLGPAEAQRRLRSLEPISDYPSVVDELGDFAT